MPRPKRDEFFAQDGVYHCVNPCVRRAFLRGEDEHTGRSFEHCRGWIQDRLNVIAGIVPMKVITLPVLSNHLHFVIRNRPDLREEWSEKVVVRRWRRLFPKTRNGQFVQLTKEGMKALVAGKNWVCERRRRLRHVSWFMRCVTENSAWRAIRWGASIEATKQKY